MHSTQSVTVIKLREKHFKVPAGTAEAVISLPSLTGLDRMGISDPAMNDTAGKFS